MNKILVILEQDEDPNIVLERALTLAKPLNASIHVLICCFQELNWLNDIFSLLENKNLKENVLQHKQDWWQEFSKPYTEKVQLSHEIIWSKYAVDSILSHCRSVQYDFVIKKGHRSGSILYTPSDWLLLRQSKIPVYLVVSPKPLIKKPILVAIDVMATSTEKQRLNSKLLSLASTLAEKTNRELHCCFAVDLPRVLVDTGFIDIEEKSEEMHALVHEKAKSLLVKYQIPDSNLYIKFGAPSKAINSVSNKIKAGLMVVGSMGKTALAGKVIGNTCEQVLHSTRIDVLVLGLNENKQS